MGLDPFGRGGVQAEINQVAIFSSQVLEGCISMIIYGNVLNNQTALVGWLTVQK